MKTKKILFVTAFPPNNRTAGQNYTFNLLKDLTDKGYIIDLIYFEYPDHDVCIPKPVNILEKIKPNFRNIFFGLPFHPFFTKRFNYNLLRRIRKISLNYDILYFDFSQVFIYALFVNHSYKVFMCHDIITQKYMRTGYLQLPWIYLCEKIILQFATKIFVFSDKDACLVYKIAQKKAKVVNFYLKENTIIDCNLNINDKLFCFYGAWNRKENTNGLKWFIMNVLPALPIDYRFIIIGGGLNIGLQKTIKNIDNLKYVGYLSDPLLEIAKCQALIAPLFSGAGVKVKVIDSFSVGTPVIGTNITFEGIKKYNGLIFKANNTKDFINILYNWKPINLEMKLKMMSGFILEYNCNHLPEYL